MNRIRKFAHADRMGRMFPVNLRQLPRLPQNVDLIYTEGKADPIWSQGDVGARGMVVRAWVDITKRCLEGIFIVDLQQCLSGSSRGSLLADGRLSNWTDFNRFRSEVFETVAHEYFHCIQEWILIVDQRDPQAMEKAYAAEMRRNERQLMADDVRWAFRPEARGAVAYLRNRFERSAHQAADSATHRLKAELDRGFWDAILPVTQMQVMLKDNVPR